MLYTGVVENREDPLKLGRCQVRVVGLHTDDKQVLPTAELPWAFPLQPITSAGINGIGWTPVGPVPGTWVVLIFRDEDCQQPIMIGTIGGIPQSKAAERVIDNSDTIATDGGIMMNSLGQPIKNSDGSALTLDENIKKAMGPAGDNVLGAIGNLLGINFNQYLKNGSLNLPSIGASDDSKPTIIPPVETGKNAEITAQPTPSAASSEVLSADIKLDPPPKYARGDTSKMRQCISALISACETLGYSSKYAKCSILGICGGESNWLPVEEGHVYSADRLQTVFPSVFKGDAGKVAQYANWKGSKADFFKEIYSPKYGPGRNVGNKQDGDGALFYGRGFNQITGRQNYERIEKDLKKAGVAASISTNPDLLINDITISALATVMFYKQRITADPSSPAFFEAALKATGGFSGSWEKKKVCYEYFLGQGVIVDSTNKSSVDKTKTYTKDEVVGLPQSRQLALLEDRSENSVIGFKDPSGKYPLRELLDEPDTNRLARGVIKETAIAFKDQTRTNGIPTANDNGSWEQPLAPFGGQYPYNKVYETESGHLMIFDDTPDNENISFYHRKGTFIDVDANGTQVNKIVGDGYTVIDRNGFIQIAGKCNITVGNGANIYVQGSCDLEVNGATQAIFHSQVDIGCAKDVNWAIGGDLNLKVDGKFNTTVLGDTNVSCDSNINTQAKGSISTNSEAAITTQATSNITVKTDALYALDAGKEVSFMSAESIKNAAKGEFTVKADSGVRVQSSDKVGITSTGDIDIRSNGGTYKATGSNVHFRALGGAVNMDGTAFRAQQGTSVVASTNTAPSGNEVDKFDKFDALTLAAPEARAGALDSFDVLQTPVRPSPPVDIKTDLTSSYGALMDDFNTNPSKYYDSNAAAAGVNPERPPQPDFGANGQSLISGAAVGDIAQFLQKQLALAKEGFWSETGMGGKTSNPNILAMWKDLGLPCNTDQTPWCAVFVNWVLKQCNYRYVQTARAFDLRDKPDRWKATKVSTPQPGDIIVWSYSHVSFVYQVNGNTIIPCGGNQGGGKVSNNNPTGGLVTINYANGISASHPNIVGIYRPSKT